MELCSVSSVRNELFAGRGFFGALKRSYNRNWKSLKNRRPRRGRPTFNQREGEGEIGGRVGVGGPVFGRRVRKIVKEAKRKGGFLLLTYSIWLLTSV